MVFLNYTTMQMTAKIVYYGPGLCGKTTNLHWIHGKTAPSSRGEMVSLETEADRTLFFDLLPLDVGMIGGMKVRLQLYTVPGQVFYNATRRLVLKGVDGVVFVADSQLPALEPNEESLANLRQNLEELGIDPREVPVVFQYNKRDLRNILPVEKLQAALNPAGAPAFEAAAIHGVGVFETLKEVSRRALDTVRTRLAQDHVHDGVPGMARLRRSVEAADAGKNVPADAEAPPTTPTAEVGAPPEPAPAAGVPAPAAVAPAPAAVAPSPALVAPAAVATGSAEAAAAPLPDPVTGDATDPALLEPLQVEFAEQDTDKLRVRPVRTRGSLDIGQELEKLRQVATESRRTPTAVRDRDVDQLFRELMSPGRDVAQELTRRASLAVPEHLLKGLTDLRIHLGFDRDGREEILRDAVRVTLVRTRKLEKLRVQLDLELKGRD
jgi:signal recognition particle receptor subunit beta